MQFPYCMCACISVYVCVCLSAPINFRMSDQIIMKRGMYIMANEATLTAYLINSPISLCVCMFNPPSRC
jgi:hypothetical protein